MKVTKNIYIDNNDQLLTAEDIVGTLFFYGDICEEIKPESWIEIKDFSINSEGNLEIDIPDSLINDIISANTETDIDKQVAELEAKLFKLLKLRDKGDKSA